MRTQCKTLPMPAHFDGRNAAAWGHRPDPQRLLEASAGWRTQFGIKPAGSQNSNVHLLLIDVQKDFCFPEGSLYVAGRSGKGAIDDNKRIAEFIYRELGVIKNVTVTLDTHFAYQIFFASFWQRQDGTAAAPFTEVTAEDVRAGRLVPNPAMAHWLCNGNYAWLRRQVEHYCAELEKAGKYKLFLWPFHCLLGTEGHALTGLVDEARLFHAFVRGAQPWAEVKGTNPLTENYSVLSPEVLTSWDKQWRAERNATFVKKLLDADALVIAGQADSHCVKSTIDDLLTQILVQDPALAKKVYIMTDCMSSVTVPDGKGGFVADYTAEAEAAHQRFADAGMRLVRSTDPIESWPGITL